MIPNHCICRHQRNEAFLLLIFIGDTGFSFRSDLSILNYGDSVHLSNGPKE